MNQIALTCSLITIFATSAGGVSAASHAHRADHCQIISSVSEEMPPSVDCDASFPVLLNSTADPDPASLFQSSSDDVSLDDESVEPKVANDANPEDGVPADGLADDERVNDATLESGPSEDGVVPADSDHEESATDDTSEEMNMTDPPSVQEESESSADAISSSADASADAETSSDTMELNNILSGLFQVGDPIPLTRREPTVSQFTFEVNMHYGLVGSGPTRYTNDIRFGLFDWWELRTAFLPYPTSLMSRFRIGSQQGSFGALVLDGGLANFDAGLRLEQGLDQQLDVGARFHFEVGVAYTKALAKKFSVFTMARYRYRYSQLDDEGELRLGPVALPIPTNRKLFQAGETDEQNAVSFDLNLTYDLLPNLAVTAGFGYAEVVGTAVREISVNFAETDRPGMNHFLVRNDGWSRSVTLPAALTYGVVDTFDVDVFVTPRIWPQFDVLFGAGLRWRI